MHKLTVSEAAKALRRELRAVKLKELWSEIPFMGEYAPFKKSLDGLASLRCTKTCRGGGGNPWCKIRKCARKEALIGCWECPDFETCGKLSERHLKNIRQIKKLGLEEFTGAKSG